MFIDEGAEEWELLYFVGRNDNGADLLEIGVAVSYKHTRTTWPRNPTAGYLPKMKWNLLYLHNNLCKYLEQLNSQSSKAEDNPNALGPVNG